MYIIVILLSCVALYISIIKIGINKLVYRIIVINGLLSLLFFLDKGIPYIQKWKEIRDEQYVIKLIESNQKYYNEELINDYHYKDFVWYSSKQTYYIFEKYSEISEQDMKYLISVVKPVDKLDISVQVISHSTQTQWIARFTNKRDLIGCTNPPFPRPEYKNICTY